MSIADAGVPIAVLDRIVLISTAAASRFIKPFNSVKA